MRAFVLEGFNAGPRLRDDLRVPEIGGGDVLIRVHASSINPVDVYGATGALQGLVEHEFPVTLGRDLAGVVERAGNDTARCRVGDEVFGFIPQQPVLHRGAFTDWVAVRDDFFIARKPASVDFLHAAAVPVAGIAALLSMEAGDVSAGKRVLIVGAPGGVGTFAVQLAALHGAHVIAPGTAEDVEFLQELGAAEVIDRHADVVAAVRERHPAGVDVLIDLVSRDPASFTTVASTVKPGARAVSTLNAAAAPPSMGILTTNVMGAPDPARLERLAQYIDAGKLRVPLQRTHRLEEMPQALEQFQRGHAQGKHAIAIA